MDFSENYRCRFQNEATNAYFEQQQVTVHPYMRYYLEKQEESLEDQNNNTKETFKLVKHSIVVISNDTRHDAHAVRIYEEKALEVLKKEFEITEIIKFSDGCAAQYKGKNSFAHLSQSDIKTSRNYFETSQGKSPCDGLGAVIKSACLYPRYEVYRGYIVFAFSVIMFVCPSVGLSFCKLFFRQRFLSNYLT